MSPYGPEYEFPKSVIEMLSGSEIVSKTWWLLWGSRIVRFRSLGRGSLYRCRTQVSYFADYKIFVRYICVQID